LPGKGSDYSRLNMFALNADEHVSVQSQQQRN